MEYQKEIRSYLTERYHIYLFIYLFTSYLHLYFLFLGVDCGVFVLHFTEMICNRFKNHQNFTALPPVAQNDIHEKRKEILQLIHRLGGR